MTAIPAPAYRTASDAKTGFLTAMQAEWTKLSSVRSTWIISGLAIVLSIGFSSVVALVMGLTVDSWGEAEQAGFKPIVSSMTGLLFSFTLLITLGVTSVTSEYSSGMIRTTFIVNPNRTRVFAAKALLVAMLGTVIHVISVPGMFLAGQAIFGSYGLETASITDSDASRMVGVIALVSALTATLIPFSIACLLRGTASAITASIGLYFLPAMTAPLLPSWIQENVIRYLPVSATDSLSGVTAPGALTYLSQTPAIIVVVTWLVGSLIAAAIFLNRRDV